MQRHNRDRDTLWVTSGLPFLTWATAAHRLQRSKSAGQSVPAGRAPEVQNARRAGG
jgi:hypothetical protein